jgi:hypothetical protein
MRACFQTVTVAHIRPIVSPVAGIPILVIRRLLNIIVAIYLIPIGAIGFGLLQ